MKKTITTILVLVLLIQSVSALSIFGREITIGQQGISIAQEKTITAQQHQQATSIQRTQRQCSSGGYGETCSDIIINEQTVEHLIDVNLVLDMVNTDETLTKMIAKFEGEKFDIITDKRTIQLSVLNEKIILHPHDVADYTLTTTEANLDFLVARAGMHPLTFGEVNSRVKIPIRLKLKTVGVLGLFGIGVD